MKICAVLIILYNHLQFYVIPYVSYSSPAGPDGAFCPIYGGYELTPWKMAFI